MYEMSNSLLRPSRRDRGPSLDISDHVTPPIGRRPAISWVSHELNKATVPYPGTASHQVFSYWQPCSVEQNFRGDRGHLPPSVRL